MDPGSGMARIMVVLGALIILAGYPNPKICNMEDLLPDHEMQQ